MAKSKATKTTPLVDGAKLPFSDPGPVLRIADVPEMPAEAAAFFATKGLVTLADLRPHIERHAAADSQCEPVFVLTGEQGLSLPIPLSYRASSALLGLLGGRVHMLKLMAGWPTQPAPPTSPVAPPPAASIAAGGEDFDESTPPPRTRPKGLPLNRCVKLPPGEDLKGIFWQWDREGRIPEGSILAELIGTKGFGLGEDSGYKLLAVAPPTSVFCPPGGTREIRARDLDKFKVAVEVRRQLDPQWYVIFAPLAKKGGA